MPITNVQQGIIGQNECAKLVMMGSGGLVELAVPVTDDDRRDNEIHVRGHYGFALAQQIKTTMLLHVSKGGNRYLLCKFDVRTSRIINNPYFWYFIAYVDPKLMRFGVRYFLCRRVYCTRRRHQGVNTLELGKRVLRSSGTWRSSTSATRTSR